MYEKNGMLQKKTVVEFGDAVVLLSHTEGACDRHMIGVHIEGVTTIPVYFYLLDVSPSLFPDCANPSFHSCIPTGCYCV